MGMASLDPKDYVAAGRDAARNCSQPLVYAGPGGAETEVLETSLNLIPYEGLEAVGRIFTEGMKKYGRDKWKGGVGDKVYQEERCSHAIRHLMLWANGDRSEAHLAKVAWFCLTQIWIEKQEKP